MVSIRPRENLLHLFNEQLRHFSTDTILFHQAVADRLGLNSTDHKCLDMILENHPMTAGKLSELTGLTTGTITGVIDRLEKAGYVCREKDAEDRRRVIIRANQEKAERDIMKHLSSLGEAVQALFDRYDDEQIEFLIDFIKRNREILSVETMKLKQE